MKKNLLLLSLAIFALRSSAQTIENPFVETTENNGATITKISTDEHFTAVTLKYTAPGDESWADVNKEMFIQTDLDNKHYNFVKAIGITISPEKTTLKKAGDALTFTVYFSKIPANAKTIDIIERAGNGSGGTYFNFYNVHLEKAKMGTAVTEVVLTPPPPQGSGNATMSISNDGFSNNMLNSLTPMVGAMVKVIMDTQVNYYQDTSKLKEIAKATRKYYNALIEQGFTPDQALKIITSESLLPKANFSGK